MNKLIKKNLNLFKTFFLPLIFFSSSQAYAGGEGITSEVEDSFTLTPIISPVKTETKSEKPAPSPGLGFGIPSGFGAGSGSAFIGISYGVPTSDGITFYDAEGEKVGDGSMNLGFGIGDPSKIAGEISIGILSMLCQDGKSCFGSDGNIGGKIHKILNEKGDLAASIGASNFYEWRETESDKSDSTTVYSAITKNLTLNNKAERPLPAQVTLGIGNGTFRSKGAQDADNDDPNVFGGFGIGFLPRISFAASWNGSTLGAGFGLAPFNFPVTMTVGLNDITENMSETKLSVNASYSLSF
jgi:hypothetical protein